MAVLASGRSRRRASGDAAGLASPKRDWSGRRGGRFRASGRGDGTLSGVNYRYASTTGEVKRIFAGCALALAKAGFDLVLCARTVVEGTPLEHSSTVRKSDTSPLPGSLETTAGEAQQVVGKLQRLIELHDWQHNILFAPIAALLLWELHCAFAVEAWRARHGCAVETWLRHVGEFEALSALATYAYEHPADPFPELAETDGPPVYEAEALAHPLIPAAAAVANDVALGASPQVLIVSGSNMSGKTTLLRSVGVSAVLALMGAPVRAGRLRLSPVAIGATLRIEDSLQAGRSRFYAEVIRLGQIVTTARTHPTLFLLDELFHGTNSHDRTEGARGLLRSLVYLNAIGLVTTHDLALAEIGEQLAPKAGNVHFDDTLVDDEMRFDYCLKAGPVTRSNAIAIMRAVGLDLPNDD